MPAVIHLALLDIPERRQRRALDEERIGQLKESIREKGLLQPIVVDDQGNGRWRLLAGGRRTEAVKQLYQEGTEEIQFGNFTISKDHIPIVEFSNLTELHRQEIELEENLQRVDLTWQERIEAVATIHALRVKENPAHREADTASELDIANTQDVHQRVLLAKFLDDPDVSKAGSETEALKILRSKMEREFRTALGTAIRAIPGARHIIKRGDALPLCGELPDDSIHVVITDPPYGIDADKRIHVQGKTQYETDQSVHKYRDRKTEILSYLTSLMSVLSKKLKSLCHLYIFCDVRRFNDLGAIIEPFGFDVWPRPMIWVKESGYTVEYGPMPRYECVLFANRGNKLMEKNGGDVLLGFAIPPGVHRQHEAEKPATLYTELLSRSCRPGDTVLDPFCGSGPIIEAAEALSLSAIAFDNDPISISKAMERSH